MSTAEQKWKHGASRREAIAGLAAVLAGSPLLHAQLDPRPLGGHRRTPGLDEMLSAFDFEPVMYANVPQATYDYTAHGDGSEHTLRRNRQAFDWVDVRAGQLCRPGHRGSLDAGSSTSRSSTRSSSPRRPRRWRSIPKAKRACTGPAYRARTRR